MDSSKITYEEVLERVRKGERFEDPEILMLADATGWAVAHTQICRGWTTEDPEILKLFGDDGWSLAHHQASKDWTTLDPDILSLKRKNGQATVLDIMSFRGWEPKTEEEKLIVFTVKAGEQS